MSLYGYARCFSDRSEARRFVFSIRMWGNHFYARDESAVRLDAAGSQVSRRLQESGREAFWCRSRRDQTNTLLDCMSGDVE